MSNNQKHHTQTTSNIRDTNSQHARKSQSQPTAPDKRYRTDGFQFSANVLGSSLDINGSFSQGITETVTISPTAGFIILGILIGSIFFATQF